MTNGLIPLWGQLFKSVSQADGWNPYALMTSKKVFSGFQEPVWHMAFSLMLATLVRNRVEIPSMHTNHIVDLEA